MTHTQEKMIKAIFEIKEPTIASEVPCKANYFQAYLTGKDKVGIIIHLKGKDIYKKKIFVCDLPTEPS